MTCLEKLKIEHPEMIHPTFRGGACGCPSTYGYLEEPEYCCSFAHDNCERCWNREVDVMRKDDKIPMPDEPNMSINEAVSILAEPGRTDVVINPGPHILDSGNRREFGTGAVRDIQEGKGRCDLMPLDVVGRFLEKAYDEYNDTHASFVFKLLWDFQSTGDVSYLYDVLLYTDRFDGNIFTMLLEVAKQFEDGAKKYGECNWQKGIPAKCYIDSAVRHYLKYLREDKDEPHDRAFVWNLMCCIWTCEHKPELNTYAGDDNNA